MKSRLRKYLAIALALVLMTVLAILPVLATEINLSVDNNSADSIYAALQLAKAPSAAEIASGSAKASIKINNVNAGATLKAYKLINITLNSNGTVASVELNPDFNTVLWTPLGITSIDDLSDHYKASTTYLSTLMNALATANLSGIPAADITETAAATGNSVTFSNMDMGTYYVVQGASGDTTASTAYTNIVPMLITVPFNVDGKWYADVTADAKNQSTSVDKTVKAAGDSTYGNTADQFINQILNYKVAIDAPQWKVAVGQTVDTTRTQLQISDTLAHQTYVDDSMKVYAIPSTVTLTGNETQADLAAMTGVVDATSWFTTTPGTGNTSFTTSLNTASFSNVMNTATDGSMTAKYAKFVFVYNAKLTSDAVVGTDSSNAGNANDVTYQYSRNPTDASDFGTLTDHTKIYTYEVNLDKYYTDKTDNTSKELAGAEFQLKNNTGDVLWFIADNTTAGKYTYYSNTLGTTGVTYYTDNTYATTSATATAYAMIGTQKYTSALVTGGTTGAAKGTNLWMIGLDAGTYTLIETKAPEGYSKISDVTITLTAATDADGNKTGALENTTISGQDVAGTTGKLNFGIEDKTGIVLPSTGGIGIILFTAVGLVVILGCVGYIVTKKSKEKYEEE
jgi:LPXTG-motif cell wall-anchored protein